ncbi:uncharacterized protein LOC128724987 [Anopheles nili]|uniref:uncharacterized protein LOC128724987 n=1 Tax=Anopheles nili TaxID=185578 RepID=UPI00237A57C2|nr:uncharacterized protein LOC128724987 [Anopheles nili]
MVFIHGGAFMIGSGNGDCYSPEYLLQEDVVVVTLNYRLGTLGFLHLPSQGIEGNAGLKDQLMVLRWVQKNISQFHGDPNNVTLFGESAGAASVHLHLLSPVSQKYFHKAICQSGNSIMEWVMQRDSIERTRTLARLINPGAKTDSDVYETLLKADVAALMGLMVNTLTADDKRRGLPMPFKPVVEEGVHGPDTVVPVHPFVALQQPGRIPAIPMIFGNNDREGTIMMMDAIKKLDLYDNDMARMIPRTVNVSPKGPSCEQLASEVKQFYFGSEGVSKKTVNQMADLMTDYHFGILANTCAEMHARYQPDSPMFYYQFSYDGELNMYKKLLRLSIPGACHADELSYMFLMRLANYDVSPETEEANVRKLMCRMWTNFAKHGHPTPDDDRSLSYRWDQVDKIAPASTEPFQLRCLNITAKPEMIMNPDKDRIDFWRGVYRKWNDDFLKFRGNVSCEHVEIIAQHCSDAAYVRHAAEEAVLDCTSERGVSLAASYLPPEDGTLASVDCLFLNVYTPINPTTSVDRVLPVMVWLHGGAFCTGSGGSSIYHPEWLVAQDTVVVTVNYRLGPEGFLCLPSVGVYGNMGLKDQRMALRWVRANIGRFGGDLNNVTLFGESAGGVSAHLHCLSEGSRPLFHKVICQSGVATSPITFQMHPESKTRRLAEHFGCPKEAPDSQLLDTLLSVAPELMAKVQKQALTAREQTLDNVYPFRPVVEASESVDPIITEDVFQLLRRPAGTNIPMIIGVNDEETLHKIKTFRQHLHRYKDEPVRFVPDMLNVPMEKRPEVAKSIIDFYCGSEGICLEKELQLTRIFTDSYYLFPAVRAAEMHVANQHSAVFFYLFTAETELNKFRQLWEVPVEHRGANHADDVCYLFGSSFFGTDAVARDSEAWNLRKAMCRLWTSFAKFGSPRLDNAGVQWTALENPNEDDFDLTMCEIGAEMTMLYVPPSVVKLPPVVDPTHLPPATAYQPPAEDLPLIIDPESSSDGTPLVFADDLQLELAPGKIVGRRKVLPDGAEYFSYQGIPYAHPPVGELRFKPPVPLEKFAEEPLLCDTEKAICPAVLYLPKESPNSEDCLYLNVYTTSSPSESLGLQKPVMVWIHGGGFYTGSGNSDWFGPENLLAHGVILVTLNYRLGPLGFLALPSLGIHGNQGLKDQQLALRWVQDNIARFGGDPTNVTLFGESAGSASVNWHYLCPKSRQYFHKAICQSGSVLCPWVLQHQPENNARKLAAVLGYEGDDDAGVLETLLNVPAADLVANAAKAFDETQTRIYLVSPFIPSVEDASSEDAIIPKRGEELLKQPMATNIPLICGVTSAEGLVMYGRVQQQLNELVASLAKTVPLDLSDSSPSLEAVVEEIRQFYFQDQPVDQGGIERLIDLVADAAFYFPIYAAVELHMRYQQEAPLYFYRFSYETELNLLAKVFGVPAGTPGASHADELPYLFSGSEYTAQVEPGSVADRARSLVCRLWTNYAKFGVPTPAEDDVGFSWEPLPPTTAEEPFVLRALDLNEQVQLVESPNHDRIQFWRSLAERFNPSVLPFQPVWEPAVVELKWPTVIVSDRSAMVMRNVFKRSTVFQDGDRTGTQVYDPSARIMVKVAQGSIYGTKDRLPNGKPYYCFKGIPYAQPPVGKLRFAPPVPIERYTVSYLDCSRERSSCLGRDVITREITGSEDGLFLNVYTPVLARERNYARERPLPVMVFFHGGGMTGGNGDSSMYLPDYLVQEDVVVATVNYRLGVLGFLCLPEAGIEGNSGLKDQRLALQWINQNASTFGGDPQNVTIFGASSGGSNVLMHCFSDLSRRYFNKAIAQSGTVFADLIYQSNPQERARSLAQIFGYEGTSDEGVLATLRDVPARRLYEAQFLVLSAREREYEPIFHFPFTTVIEREQSTDAVLRKTPMEYLREKDYLQVPVLCGYNDKEGMLELVDMIKNLAVYNSRPEKFICGSFDVDYFSPAARVLGEELKRHYFGEAMIDRTNLDRLVELLSDRFVVGYYVLCQLWSTYQTKAPFYSYRFAFEGALNKGKELLKFQHLPGACHIDEVYYLFSSALLRTEIPPTDPAYEVRQRMVRMWTNFAKHSDPTPTIEGSDGVVLSCRWEPMRAIPGIDGQPTNYSVLSIGKELKMGVLPEVERLGKFLDVMVRCNGSIDNFVIPRIHSRTGSSS